MCKLAHPYQHLENIDLMIHPYTLKIILNSQNLVFSGLKRYSMLSLNHSELFMQRSNVDLLFSPRWWLDTNEAIF